MAKLLATRVARVAGAAPMRFAIMALAILTPMAAWFAAMIGGQVNAILAERTAEGLRGELRMLRSEFDRGGASALSDLIVARSAEPGPYLYRLALADVAAAVGNLPTMPAGLSQTPTLFHLSDNTRSDEGTAVGVVVDVTGGGHLIVARRIDDQIDFANTLRRSAFGGVAALGFVSLGLGWWTSRRFIERLAGVTATSQSIMAGDLSRRIPRDYSTDELDLLAANLNAMLARIEELMLALREVSDNIAHDLKTPLTRLRNRAEAALRDDQPAAHRDGLERIIEEADGLIQTFNALLLIARLEAGAVDATREDCDLAQLAADVAELYQPVADEAGLALVVAPGAPAPLAVNRQLIGQAMANLIDNAIKYSMDSATATTGPIVVSTVACADGAVELTVADRGPGIPDEDRERATRRFVRLEQSRSRPGTGLGLSLVAAVARLHGGTMRLDDNAPGLRVVLTLRQPAVRFSPVFAPAHAPGETDLAQRSATPVGRAIVGGTLRS